MDRYKAGKQSFKKNSKCNYLFDLELSDLSVEVYFSSFVGTDLRFFLEPLKTFDESHHLSYQLYCLLKQLAQEDSLDLCTKYYTDVLLGRIPHITQVKR